MNNYIFATLLIIFVIMFVYLAYEMATDFKFATNLWLSLCISYRLNKRRNKLKPQTIRMIKEHNKAHYIALEELMQCRAFQRIFCFLDHFDNEAVQDFIAHCDADSRGRTAYRILPRNERILAYAVDFVHPSGSPFEHFWLDISNVDSKWDNYMEFLPFYKSQQYNQDLKKFKLYLDTQFYR